MGDSLHSIIENEDLSALILEVQKLMIKEGIKETQRQLANESKAGAHSSIDPTSMINIIPSESIGNVMCCNVVMAIAHGSRGIGGLCQVMQQLRKHLICCADSRTGMSTKTAIIIYDKEESRVFWENRKDFETHMLRNGVSFIRLFWDGHQLIKR